MVARKAANAFDLKANSSGGEFCANLLQRMGKQPLLLILRAALALEQGNGRQGPAEAMRNHTHAGNTHQLFGNVRRHDGDGALVGRDQFTDDFSGQALDERKRRLDTRAQEENGNLFTNRGAVRNQHPDKLRPIGPLLRPFP